MVETIVLFRVYYIFFGNLIIWLSQIEHPKKFKLVLELISLGYVTVCECNIIIALVKNLSLFEIRCTF